jgi:hypothetical protein
VHEVHIAATGATAPGQPPPPTHVVAHPDQALMTKYYSTITQTDQAGDPRPHADHTSRKGHRPQPPARPTRTNRATRSPGRGPPHRDKKRKTAERVTMSHTEERIDPRVPATRSQRARIQAETS